MRHIAIAAALLFTTAAAADPSVQAERGNIVLIDGKRHVVLTHSGHDRDPALTPDGKRVVFTREGPPSKATEACALDGRPMASPSLWVVGSDGKGEKKLLTGHSADNPELGLCGFYNKQFSTNGARLYFDSPAWATSSAVHVLDMASGKEKYFLAGSLVRVLAGCRDARYRDDLIVSQHRYYVFAGSYDWTWLFTPQGKEVGPVGDEDPNMMFVDDACAYGD